MDFEWDEKKRHLNRLKHGVDLAWARAIFHGPTVENRDSRRDYGEARIGAFGEVDGEVLFVVYTWRGAKRRLISAGKARQDERARYRQAIAQARTASPNDG